MLTSINTPVAATVRLAIGSQHDCEFVQVDGLRPEDNDFGVPGRTIIWVDAPGSAARLREVVREIGGREATRAIPEGHWLLDRLEGLETRELSLREIKDLLLKRAGGPNGYVRLVWDRARWTVEVRPNDIHQSARRPAEHFITLARAQRDEGWRIR